ncbi:F-box only protein 38 [Parasteatoda tepidariorum]|uniref:F-box only protein 38 n=1 Tax=Parasteatoda tepidariorum TaxID=114398 RepID=UPI0039BD5623
MSETDMLDMSHELLCHILQYLPLHEVLSLSMLCRKLFTAVGMYLQLCKSIDFCEGKMYGYMPSSMTDDHIHALFRKCPHVEYVYGLHPQRVERRRLRQRRSALTVPGIIEALSLCGNLKAVEISDLRLLEALMQHLPDLEIIGNFQNRDGVFPPHASHRLKLQPYPRIFSLHLVGVEVPELTAMPHLKHLHLQCVRFTKLQPFRGFLAQNLKSFVMKHCMGPSMSLRYLSLIIALSSAPSLTRLELVRVPLPGGLFQRAIEDSYRHNGFVNLKHLVISGCKGVLESDLGHLMIVSSKNLESISIQPSLTRDSLFVSLSFAQCSFPQLKSLHLGFIDKLSISGEWSNDTLLTLGLAEIPDTPSSLTDSGMKIIVELFPKMKSLSVSNCPHLMAMDQWYNSLGDPALQELTDLTLQHCHCIQLPSFALFLAFLPKVQVVILNDMFREPPKGCSHVGLSAGTGLGMSSAVVSNQDEHVAVNGNQQDFEAQGEDLIENDDLDEIVENGRYQEPHRMVLPQEFFDDQNNAAAAVAPVSLDSDAKNGTESEDTDSDGGRKPTRKRPFKHSCTFDPTQPSTSKSGNCLCACDDSSDPEMDASSPLRTKRSAIIVKKIKKEHDYSKTKESGFSDSEEAKSAVDCLVNPESSSRVLQDETGFETQRNKGQSSKKTVKRTIHESHNFVSEGTQATSADIRRSHKKQKASPPKRRSQRRTNNQNGSLSNLILESCIKFTVMYAHVLPLAVECILCTLCVIETEQQQHEEVDSDAVTSSKSTVQCGPSIELVNDSPSKLTCSNRNGSFCQGKHANITSKGHPCGESCFQLCQPSFVKSSAREEHKKSKRKQDFSLQNKATSTSDPLMEDDAVQILRLVSESLISLSVIACGVSDVIVDHCHNLTHLEVQACRILKRLQLLHSPNLQRLNIGQCPKLEMDTLVLQVLCNLSYVNILVTFEPCIKTYYPQVSEKIIFQRAAANQSLILVHDYSGESNENATFKENIIAWMGIVQKMRNSTLGWRERKTDVNELSLPMLLPLFKCIVSGVIPSSSGLEKSKYQILTNDRLFTAAIEVMPWEKGIPPPCETLEWEADNQFTNQLFRSKFMKRLIAFYIPVSSSQEDG